MARPTSWWPRQIPRIGSARLTPREDAASRSVRVAERAFGPESADEGARVDPYQTGHAVRPKISIEIHGALAARADEFADDEPFDPWAPALAGALERPVVADERVRQDDDLPVVGSVRRDLLVTGHRRVEHDLARGRRPVAEGLSPPRRAVFQSE